MFAIDQPYTFALITSVIISISIAVAVMMHKHTLGVHAFAVLNAAIGMWAFTSLFEVCSMHMPTKIFSYSFKYVFIVMVPLAWFIFGLYYSNRLRRLRWPQLGLLSVIPVLTLVAVSTNRYHGLMFTSLGIIETGTYEFIVRKFGTWFWMHATYSYALILLGFLFMAKHLMDSPSPYRWQVVSLLIGGLVPWIANICFTYNLTPYPFLDLTPFAFTISGVAFMWGIMRFQLLDVAPVAHEMVVHNIEDAILVVDGEQRILNLNPAANKLIDLLTVNPVGTKADLVFSWWPKVRADDPESADTQRRVIDLSHGDQRCLLRLKKVPFLCNHKKMGMLITLTNVTDALLAKEALFNSERRFRSLSENAPVIIFALDTNGAITYLNPAWKNILGHNRDDLMGKPLIDLIADKNDWLSENIFDQLISGQKSVIELNITLRHKLGYPRLFNTSLAANSDTEGRVTGIIGMAKDITEERKLQQQLFQSQKMEAIGTLAGGVAHDFNNLLMGMQANLSLMRIGDGPAVASDEKIQRIENQIQTGAALTRQLLGYARKGQYVVTTINMNDLIEETLNVVQRANKSITVQNLISDEPAFIKGDRGQMEMVMLNLFLNAVDAMPGGGRLTVSCRRMRLVSRITDTNDNGQVEIVVSDTGVGMEQAIQDRIFEPFFTTKEVGRGSGLGLASVYGVVKNHGGRVTVESELGQGSTFTLYFPATEDIPPEPVAIEMGATPISGGTILLVEDEALILKYCSEMIESLDFDVLTAADGDQAIQIYKKHFTEIDLVILDMIMPGMDGFSVFKVLCEINPQVSVIITSGFTIDRRMEQILSSGPHGYLKKPYTLDELADEIAKTMSRRYPDDDLSPVDAN